MRYVVAAGVAAAVLLAGWFLFVRERPITNYPSTGTDIIAFGDSLVSGVGSSGGGFVELLSEQLGMPITNLGVPGDTTATGLARIDELDQYTPKVVMVLLGGNDYLKRIDSSETFSNLALIIEEIHNRGAIVLLLGVRGGLLFDNFDTEFKKLGRTYDVAHVPNVLDGLVENPALMTDRIHPNDAGYAIIAERILPVLRELVQ